MPKKFNNLNLESVMSNTGTNFSKNITHTSSRRANNSIIDSVFSNFTQPINILEP
jgi:hypothetical protein